MLFIGDDINENYFEIKLKDKFKLNAIANKYKILKIVNTEQTRNEMNKIVLKNFNNY